MNDDLDTIRRVLAADVESFRRLVERYQRPLLTLIRNLTPTDTDHEGVAQEVFLAAFRSLASFDPKRRCRTGCVSCWATTGTIRATAARSASWPLATCSATYNTGTGQPRRGPGSAS